MPAEIHYSQNHVFYYITDGDNRPKVWMSTEETPGALPEELKGQGKLFDPIWAEFELTDGRIYYRKILEFALWKVSSADIAPISRTDDKYLDYAAYHFNHYGGEWEVPKQMELFDEAGM